MKLETKFTTKTTWSLFGPGERVWPFMLGVFAFLLFVFIGIPLAFSQ